MESSKQWWSFISRPKHRQIANSYIQDKTGVRTKYWFWGHEGTLSAPQKTQSKPVKDDTPETNKPDLDPDQLARQIILDHPEMSAATLLNTLKSKGIILSKGVVANEPSKPTEESDSGSTATAQLRAKGRKKESNFKLNETIRFELLESIRDDGIGATKFKTVLLQEGLGNLRDGYYYTKEALDSAVTLFEGKKMFADHPSIIEEQTRPERSVRDVIGHYENVRVEEAEDGRHELVADAVLLPDKAYEWARGLIRHAVDFGKKFPDKHFVGLSINASGDAVEVPVSEFLKETDVPQSAMVKLQNAIENGLSSVRLVQALSDAVSVDLVTEPGAGGRVLEMMEQNKQKENKMSKQEAKKEAADESHDDAAQDKELVKSMLKKHGLVKDGEEAGDDDMKMASDMMAAYHEMGYEGEEAMKCAGHSMKLAKHMASKQAEAKQDESDKDEEKESALPKENADHAESNVKALHNKIIELSAKVAKLTEANKKTEIEAHIDSVLAGSKMSNQATKLFRESIGTPKSVEEVDKAFKLFKSAYTASSTEGERFVFTDKVVETDSKTTVGFDDCMN